MMGTQHVQQAAAKLARQVIKHPMVQRLVEKQQREVVALRREVSELSATVDQLNGRIAHMERAAQLRHQELMQRKNQDD